VPRPVAARANRRGRPRVPIGHSSAGALITAACFIDRRIESGEARPRRPGCRSHFGCPRWVVWLSFGLRSPGVARARRGSRGDCPALSSVALPARQPHPVRALGGPDESNDSGGGAGGDREGPAQTVGDDRDDDHRRVRGRCRPDRGRCTPQVVGPDAGLRNRTGTPDRRHRRPFVALVGTRIAGLRPVVDDEQLTVLRVLVDRRRSLGTVSTRRRRR
jgi:hypothetical protein